MFCMGTFKFSYKTFAQNKNAITLINDIPAIFKINPIFAISFILMAPEDMAMAFGGVAIGSIKA